MNSTIRGAGLALLAALPLPALAQLTPATWPAPLQLVREGVALHDKADFAAAAAKYRAVLPGDSTYALAQSELALSLDAAGQHQEAVAAARRALALAPDQPRTYGILADALDDLKQLDEALATYQLGLKRFPYNQELHYYQGVVQLLNSQTQGPAALRSLQRALELRPLHPNPHRMLALLAAEQGQTAHALLGLLTFLALAEADENHRNALVQAERLSLGVPIVDEKERIKPLAPNTAFAELDQLLDSKVALQDAYVSKVKFNAAVVKQAQLLVEKFPVDGPADDFWVRAYGPMVRVLRQADYLTTFTYLALQSADDKRAEQWIKGNKPKVDKLFAALAPAMLTLRDQQQVAGGAPGQRQRAWFSDNNTMFGLGPGQLNVQNEVVSTGDWLSISGEGAVEARGGHTAAGKQTGLWQYLRPDGSVEKTFTYDQQGLREGPAREFYANGQPSLELTYHLDKIEGPLTMYNECGGRTELRTFKAGDLSGPYTTYYPGGQLRYRATLLADKVQGLEEQLYPDGTPEYSYTYADGKKQGPAAVYYPDKTPEKKILYDQDQLHGAYTDYHANGQPDNSGTYERGKQVGLWRSYFPNGKLSVERSYDAAGELHGLYYDCDEQGRRYAAIEYNHGQPVALRYLDAQGKVTLDQPFKKSRTAMRIQRPDGRLDASGAYLNGERTGEWKWFFRDGRVRETASYDAKGIRVGRAETYWQSGKPRQRQFHAADGRLDGGFEQFYAGGQPSQSGYFYQGQRHGLWKEFYVSGQLSSETYYYKGAINGPSRSYAPGGQLTQARELAFGSFRRVTTYDSLGRVLAQNELKPDSKEMKFLYPSGKLYYQAGLRCYQSEGPTRWLRPDGSLESSFAQLNDERHGPYQASFANGKPEAVGSYVGGQRQGEWRTYFANGQPQAQGRYRAGQQDGEWRYFFPSGQLSLAETHQAGELHGLSQRYNPAGELLIEKIYDHGDLLRYRGPGPAAAPYTELPADLSGPVRTVFANGRPAAEETYDHNTPTGPATYYYAAGPVFRREAYGAAGLRTGRLESFWATGKPLEQEHYQHGNLHGRSRYFRPDGTLEREESYREGERSGPTTYFDAAGKKDLRTEHYWNQMLYDKK